MPLKPPADSGASQQSARPGDRPSAVALSHAGGNGGPVVVAKGYGEVAEAIIQRARESGLYVHASQDLVKLLMNVDLDERIPPQLYLAVAQILEWLHSLESDARKN